MTRHVLSVPEISCDHCKASIESALGGLAGVASARVDVAAKTVAVEIDPARTSLPEVVGAVEAQGYSVAPSEGREQP